MSRACAAAAARATVLRRALRLGLSPQSRWQGGRWRALVVRRRHFGEACGRDGSTGSRTRREGASPPFFFLRVRLAAPQRAAYVSRCRTGLSRVLRTPSEPIFNVPAVVTAIDRGAGGGAWRARMGAVARGRQRPALAVRLRAGALRVVRHRPRRISGRRRGGCLDLRHLCVAARKLDAPDPQFGLAAGIRHARSRAGSGPRASWRSSPSRRPEARSRISASMPECACR